jgi:hypothetical protein
MKDEGPRMKNKLGLQLLSLVPYKGEMNGLNKRNKS